MKEKKPTNTKRKKEKKVYICSKQEERELDERREQKNFECEEFEQE